MYCIVTFDLQPYIGSATALSDIRSCQCRFGQQTPVFNELVMVHVRHSEASYTLQDLDSGTYEVTVTSAIGSVLGNESRRESFILPG